MYVIPRFINVDNKSNVQNNGLEKCKYLCVSLEESISYS